MIVQQGAVDPLSDVLAVLRPRAYFAHGIDVGGALSIRFDAYEGIKCYAISSGTCWLRIDGEPDSVELGPGDCFLLASGRPFVLATDRGLAPVEMMEMLERSTRRNGVTTFGGGGDAFMVGAYFTLSGPNANMLLGILPPVVHIREEADRVTLRFLLDRMRHELSDGQPGSVLIAEHLAHMVLVQALRLHLADGARGGVGWLFALADEQIGAAIGAMHENPARRWTLQQLAERAAMSRSSFALKFKSTVGTPPLEYLTRWRMVLAADRLATTRAPISEVADALGYDSESAFSTAFKRTMGRSPRRYAMESRPTQLAG